MTPVTLLKEGFIFDEIKSGTKCLHELFEAQVDIRPSEPALICGDKSLSYLELDDMSNQLAHYLLSYGVRPGKLVGLYFERSERPIISILAVLKTGAGYVPIDPIYPEERIQHIITEAEIDLLLTERKLLQSKLPYFKGTAIPIDSFSEEIEKHPSVRISREQSGVTHRDISYVIYTSGTTGRPKGVMTEHRNVVEFIFSFNKICRLNNRDRVYQGFSFGFDGSVEEIWMAFSNGATLVVGTQNIIRFGDEVARLLKDKKVTVFSTVPTFLSMITKEMPTVRLLIVSGEQCTSELVAKWAKANRRMLNVYGPTETTVNATAKECEPNKPITIGKPLRGYETYILDPDMRQVKPGESGELYIGGIGLARGYLNQQELTKKAFVKNPFCKRSNSQRLYRTGDLVCRADNDELIFLGRIDNQVKLRGFRIELSEIEAVLKEHPMVRSAAVKIFERDGIQDLAAYVISNSNGGVFNREELLNLLQKKLPDYMIPGYLDLVDEFPTLTSGKVDRKSLPKPYVPLIRTRRKIVEPETDLEYSLKNVWEKIFNVSPISTEDNFFLDLGGHSLLAAQMVSLLRNELQIEIAIRDIYKHPTIKQLAKNFKLHEYDAFSDNIKNRNLFSKKSNTSKMVFEDLSRFKRWCCIGLQALSLYLIYGISSLPIIILFLLFLGVINGYLSLGLTIKFGFAISLGFYPAILTLSILVKWLIIGRYKPGKYPVWGLYYFRWWLVTRFQTLSGVRFLAGTPLINIYYRLMGAKIGRNCIIDTSLCFIFDLITIGEDTSIGNETQILGYRVEDGMLILGRVDIGNRCYLGIHSTVGLNTIIGDDARLDDLSFLPDEETMKPGESRHGSPAQPADVAVPEITETRRHPMLFGIFHLLAIYALEFFIYICGLPSIALLWLAYFNGGVKWLIISLFAVPPLGLISFCLFVAAIKSVLIGDVKPGVYAVESSFYLRKWFIDSLIRISCHLIRPLYTTIYLPSWLRLLGAKIGVRSEIATVSQITPELMDIGDESFFADGSIIGGRRFFRGHLEIAVNKIGCRSFVGNSAILPIGASLGDNCLIGCLSSPPMGVQNIPVGSEWLGSPSFELPRRQKIDGFDETLTYRPSKKLYIQRLIIDALRILIPGYIQIASFGVFLSLNYVLYILFGLFKMLALAPLIGLAVSIIAALCVVGVKMFLIGKFKPIIRPLWSIFVWLNEVINGAYESVSAPALTPLLGTPFFAAYLRLLGCKIGKNVFLETTLFSEFDLVNIGDYAALNIGAVIQNHLFEDRIMKASYLKIGDECSVGNMAVVLYDSEMKQGSSIGPLSLLMKGEIIPEFSYWHGIPTEQVLTKQANMHFHDLETVEN